MDPMLHATWPILVANWLDHFPHSAGVAAEMEAPPLGLRSSRANRPERSPMLFAADLWSFQG